MRPYDDLVEVRKGPTDGLEGVPEDRPEQFLWRGRLWQVREVLAHWVDTGAWWVPRETGVGAGRIERAPRHREVWRVTAARGRAVASVDDPGSGIFDLAFDWGEGVWRLAASAE